MPELDTLRGIAVLLVLFFHGFGFEFGLRGLSGPAKLFVAATLPGWAGVNLFFVLSGFLITGILLDTQNRADYFRRFYYHRALRILPIYYAVLILLAVFSRTGLISRPASWSFLGLSAIYLANMTEFFGVRMQYGVLWTLAIEEHFYLIWPAVVRHLSRRNVAVAGGAIFIICALLRYFYCLMGYDAGQGYTWLYADGLALGAVLAAAVRGPWGTRAGMQRIAALLLLSSLAMFGFGAPGIFLASHRIGMVLRPTVLNIFFAGLIVLFLLIGTSKWQFLVNRPLLQFIGEISYGVYLIHMLMFDLVDRWLPASVSSLANGNWHFEFILLRFCLGAGATIVVAYLSRRYFEEFFLKFKNS
jgi:peptidoglycan/LPS O-acetylase OafA/YrhL